MSAAAKLAQVLAEHGCDYEDCASCGPVDDLAQHQAAVVLAHLTAEGWAQGREEWGVGYIKGATGESRIVKYDTADIAEIAASGLGAVFPESMARVVRRRVTDWEPVEGGQP